MSPCINCSINISLRQSLRSNLIFGLINANNRFWVGRCDGIYTFVGHCDSGYSAVGRCGGVSTAVGRCDGMYTAVGHCDSGYTVVVDGSGAKDVWRERSLWCCRRKPYDAFSWRLPQQLRADVCVELWVVRRWRYTVEACQGQRLSVINSFLVTTFQIVQ